MVLTTSTNDASPFFGDWILLANIGFGTVALQLADTVFLRSETEILGAFCSCQNASTLAFSLLAMLLSFLGFFLAFLLFGFVLAWPAFGRTPFPKFDTSNAIAPARTDSTPPWLPQPLSCTVWSPCLPRILAKIDGAAIKTAPKDLGCCSALLGTRGNGVLGVVVCSDTALVSGTCAGESCKGMSSNVEDSSSMAQGAPASNSCGKTTFCKTRSTEVASSWLKDFFILYHCPGFIFKVRSMLSKIRMLTSRRSTILSSEYPTGKDHKPFW